MLEFIVMFSLTQISSAPLCASVEGHKSWSLQCLINELESGRHFFILTELADFTAVSVLVSLLLLKRLFPSPGCPETTLTMGSFSVSPFVDNLWSWMAVRKLWHGKQAVLSHWSMPPPEQEVMCQSDWAEKIFCLTCWRKIYSSTPGCTVCLFVLGPVHFLFPLVVLIINVIKQEGLSCDEMRSLVLPQLTGWHTLFISDLALKLLK